MKQTIYKSGLSAILLLAGMLTGCIKDDMSITNGTGEAAIEVQLQTYAVNSDSNAANEGELIVKSAHVFIFNADNVLENAGNTVVGTTTSTGEVINASGTLNAKWKVNEGNKDIYIVTNPGAELAGRLSSMSATNGLTKSTLEAVLTNEANFSTDVAGFSSNGMIMSGKVTAAAVSNTNTTVTVGVTRRHARIEFMLRKSKELEGSTVEVKSVKFKDQIRKTLVFGIGTHRCYVRCRREDDDDKHHSATGHDRSMVGCTCGLHPGYKLLYFRASYRHQSRLPRNGGFDRRQRLHAACVHLFDSNWH